MADRRPTDAREIVLTAARLFAGRGYAATSVAEIVAEVGCTPPRLYRRFPSKLALLHAVLDAALDATISPGGDLDAHVRRAIAAASEQPDLVVTYVRERRWIDPDGFPEIARRDADHVAAWRDAIVHATPLVDATTAALRHAAIAGAVAALAVAPRGTGGARLRAAFACGLHDLATSRLRPRRPAQVITRPAWRLPPTRRQLLIDAAITLIGARGYADVRVDDVGAVVGIGGSSVLQHFATKQEILVAAFDRALIQMMVSATTAIESASDAADALDRLVVGLAETVTAHRDLYTTLYREFGALDAPDRSRVAHLRTELDHMWGAVMGELSPGLAAEPARAIARAGVESVLTSARQNVDDATSPADLAAPTLAFLDGAARAMT